MPATAPTTIFGFEVPLEVPGVDSGLLEPRSTWRDPEAYDERAEKLPRMFRENFEQFGDPPPRRRRPSRLAG